MLYAFAVKDEKADAFSAPFFVPSKGLAVRNFGDECKRKETIVGQHPEDFRLYYIGFYEEQSALMVAEQISLASSGSDWAGA